MSATERFDVVQWASQLRVAIEARDGNRLADLMTQNDKNGCFAYDDVCFEFGDTTNEEWIGGLVATAEDMLSELN
jgi:hypothetical protein